MTGVCSVMGDASSADFGRGANGAGEVGDGDAEFLAKGLFRHRGPFGAGALMVVLYMGMSGKVRRRYLAASARRIMRRRNKLEKQGQTPVRSLNYNYVQG